ncbi:hypothetical protein JTB14_038452 [Gonioctena quinquepunctata]|nr:hypothetical protein JTB14_038452 [Gonioctena quinquepunctata]
MNRIHTAILALVLGIFLIQAADPPYETSTGSFLQFYPFGASKKSSIDSIERDKPKNIINSDKIDDKKYSVDRQFLNSFLQPPPLENWGNSQGNQEFPEQPFRPHQPLPPLPSRPIIQTPHIQSQTHIQNGLSDIEEISGNTLSLYPPIQSIEDHLFANQNHADQQLHNAQISGNTQNNDDESLGSLHNYLKQINNDSRNPGGTGEPVQKEKTAYDELLEKDFIKPLLKLYEKEIHEEPEYPVSNASYPARISKEDYEGNYKVLSKDEIETLVGGIEKLQIKDFRDQNEAQQQVNKSRTVEEFVDELDTLKREYLSQKNNKEASKNYFLTNEKMKILSLANDVMGMKKVRRDDISPLENRDQEHIGEILPVNFNENIERTNQGQALENLNLYRSPNYRMRKSYEYDDRFSQAERSELPRIPIVFPGERYKTGFEPTGGSTDYTDASGFSPKNFIKPSTEQLFSRSPRLSLTPLDAYRTPRRFRGFRDYHSDGFQPYFDPSARFQSASAWSSRRPRVIFPSDQVSFRDSVQNPSQEAEPEWLAGDNALQDLQEPDIRDRGCGVSTPRQAQRRIVGGEEAGFGTFPWQAYIRIGSSRCGGSLVSKRHVVTAGHCVARAAPRQVHVTLGDYVINSAVEPLPAYTFGVSSIQVHPFFKFTPQADRFDVAVLRLDRAAHNLPHITPICLPQRGENFLGEVGVAAGWGALSPGSRLRPQTLQAVQVPVIENRQCERWHRSKGISVTIYDEMMCAGYKTGGRDSCQGDSGGPLMLQRTGRWFLIGIVSAGYSCAQPGQPGIYHRVAHTVDWITRAIGS